MKVDITELGLAYRRAKADLYYTKHANSAKILQFEKELVSKLRHVHEILEAERFQELLNQYCSGWRLVPKSVSFVDDDSSKVRTTIKVGDDLCKVDKCDLRIIEDVPMEFHIVTQLWIDRVAGRLDHAMSDSSYGYRIRRHGEEVNLFYPGSFRYWMRQYQDWHNGGLDIIRRALENGKDVAVLSADFSAFYHNLSPNFILREDFQEALGVGVIRGDEQTLTALVVSMLNKWASDTPLGVGLPVGCSISSVFANLALTLLDRKIMDIPGKVYYGRYVDDIILAVENTRNLGSQDEFLNWLCSLVQDLRKDNESVSYIPDWLELEKGCRLSFQMKKTKVFLFKAKDGKDFVVGLQNQISKRTSEWRALPELPDDPIELIKSIIAITDQHGVEVDKLRQAEEASIRRAAFAMKLSDFADYALCLSASDWVAQRDAFIKAVSIYFTTVKNYFELNRYFPRLLALAVYGMSMADDKSLEVVHEMLQRIAKAIGKAFEGDVTVSGRRLAELKYSIDAKERLVRQVVCEFAEAISSAVVDGAVRTAILEVVQTEFPLATEEIGVLPSYDEMLLADLAQQPYKSLLFTSLDVAPCEFSGSAHPIRNLNMVVPKEMYENTRAFLAARKEWSRDLLSKEAYSGLIFPVRKLSTIELYAIFPNPYSKSFGERDIINTYLRFVSYANAEACEFLPAHGNKPCVIKVIDERPKEEADKEYRSEVSDVAKKVVHIALAYWRMSEKDWETQVSGVPGPNRAARFARLMGLTNNMLRARYKRGNGGLDYILYPELAMPWRWFLLVQKKVKRHGISLISGVEYIRSTRRTMLRNEVWCALKYYGGGFPDSLLVRVLKTAPAGEEAQGLSRYGFILDCLSRRGSFRAGDVIMHGHGCDFLFFSILICSDLTDIRLRTKLRGCIDLLCVPAWNQDVKTFNALITSSAHDLHSYVALCNNGEYGDTRIRVPSVMDYARDVVQLKGGDNDYWVVASVNANAIRRFHAKCPAPEDPKFKPLPIGFRMSEERQKKVLGVLSSGSGIPYRYIRIGESYLSVHLPDVHGRVQKHGLRVDFSKLTTTEKVLQQVKFLSVRKGVTTEVIAEFIQACEIYMGIEI